MLTESITKVKTARKRVPKPIKRSKPKARRKGTFFQAPPHITIEDSLRFALQGFARFKILTVRVHPDSFSWTINAWAASDPVRPDVVGYQIIVSTSGTVYEAGFVERVIDLQFDGIDSLASFIDRFCVADITCIGKSVE